MKTYIYAALFLLLAACGEEKPKDTKEAGATKPGEQEITLTAAQLQNAALVISQPETRTLRTTIQVNGQVDVPPQSMISISFPLGGYLKSSHLLPGMGVKKGEVIATLEDQSYVQMQQEYLVAKARMEFLLADLQRQKELSDQEAASKRIYQQALTEHKTQQVMIRSLEEKLRIVGIDPDRLTVNSITRTISLRSPITGYVTKVNVNIGKYVNPADVLFELVDPDDIHAALTVFEKDIMSVRKGMKATVALADKPGRLYEVDVILVTRNVDESRSGLVHCHFENSNHELLPGMFLTATFELANKAAVTVPEESVVRFEGKQYVFIAKANNVFFMQEVETGIQEKGLVELKPLEGINWLNQQLVVKNAYTLLGKLKNKMEEE